MTETNSEKSLYDRVYEALNAQEGVHVTQQSNARDREEGHYNYGFFLVDIERLPHHGRLRRSWGWTLPTTTLFAIGTQLRKNPELKGVDVRHFGRAKPIAYILKEQVTTATGTIPYDGKEIITPVYDRVLVTDRLSEVVLMGNCEDHVVRQLQRDYNV